MRTFTHRLVSLSLLLLALVATALPASARDDIEADGTIEAIGASSLTVQGLTFAVTDQTEIVDDDDRPLSFDDLAVGLAVEVKGHQLGDGSLVADEIEVEDDGDDNSGDDEIEAEGLVTARTDASLTVGGLTFAVTDQTEIDDDDDAPLSFDDIVVGLYVEVEGYVRSDGTLVASEIKIEDDRDGDDEDVEVEGRIEDLDAESLTVSGITFAVTSQTIVVDDNDRPLSFDALAVDLYVEVHGIYGANGSLLATKIEIEDFDDDELELRGAIEALSDASLTVLGVEFLVDDQTRFEDDDNLPITFADLAVGDIVEVHARFGANGERIATRVEIEDGARGQQEIEVKAALDATGDGLVVVLGRPFLVTGATRLLGLDDEPITLSDFPVGESVEVDARRDSDGTLIALTIEREDDPATGVRLRARVTGFAPDTVFVMNVPFAAASAQVIRSDGSAGTLDDLAVGHDVLVTGTQDATGVQAAVIEIRRSAQASGRVRQTSPDGFALPGLAVATTAQTLFVTDAGTSASVDDVAAGSTVRVFGTLDTEGGLRASRVVILASPNAVATDAGPQEGALTIERIYPNPTTSAATVRVALAERGQVQVAVVDLLGRTVLEVEQVAAGGTHEVRLDTSALPAGTYLVRATVEGRPSGTSRLTVVR